MDPAPRLPTTRGERLTVVALALTLAGLLVADLLQGFHVDKLSVLFVVLLWPVVSALHAFGHALSAGSVGWPLREIAVGFGREIYRLRVRRTRVVVRLLPFGGYVVPEPPAGQSTGGRAARVLVYAGGPVANLALAWGLSGTLQALGSGAGEPGAALVAAQSLAVAASMAALLALFPYSVRGNPSDGLAMIYALVLDRGRLRDSALVPLVDEGIRLLLLERHEAARALVEQGLERHGEDPRLEGLLAVCEAAGGEPDDAFARLEAVGPPERHPPPVEAMLLTCAAWSVLVSGDDDALLVDARKACSRALELEPGWSHAALLLGCIELELGRAGDAYGHLAKAYEATARREEEAQCVAWLALSCHALAHQSGSPQMAGYSRRFAAAIDEEVLGPALVARTRRELARGEPGR